MVQYLFILGRRFLNGQIFYHSLILGGRFRRRSREDVRRRCQSRLHFTEAYLWPIEATDDTLTVALWGVGDQFKSPDIQRSATHQKDFLCESAQYRDLISSQEHEVSFAIRHAVTQAVGALSLVCFATSSLTLAHATAFPIPPLSANLFHFARDIAFKPVFDVDPVAVW